MRESTPTAYATSSTSAFVFSHSAEMALIDDMRCARKAFDAILASSALHALEVMIRSAGTQRL